MVFIVLYPNIDSRCIYVLDRLAKTSAQANIVFLLDKRKSLHRLFLGLYQSDHLKINFPIINALDEGRLNMISKAHDSGQCFLSHVHTVLTKDHLFQCLFHQTTYPFIIATIASRKMNITSAHWNKDGFPVGTFRPWYK